MKVLLQLHCIKWNLQIQQKLEYQQSEDQDATTNLQHSWTIQIYFNGEGAVDFQYNQIDTYVEWNTLNDLSYKLSLFIINILHRSAYIILNTRN